MNTRELHLNAETALSDAQKDFLRETMELRNAPAVFYTYVTDVGVDYTLMTTRRHIDERLGQYPPQGLNALCRMLNHAFAHEKTPLLLFLEVEGDDPKGRKPIMVTTYYEDGRTRSFQLDSVG